MIILNLRSELELRLLGNIPIVSRMNDEAKNWTDNFSAVFTNSNKGWGFPSFITLAELMDPSNGFYDKDEDKVTLAIHFIVNPNQKTGRKFQSLLDPK
ncbi:hypothetical protein niasHT_026828 [Heterodera trifolii]|uniref:MATH domain-containing protein n=1 Tax=Heterodera trifolii TaxID=157864 RepID=A0ABD2KFD6_9BILA